MNKRERIINELMKLEGTTKNEMHNYENQTTLFRLHNAWCKSVKSDDIIYEIERDFNKVFKDITPCDIIHAINNDCFCASDRFFYDDDYDGTMSTDELMFDHFPMQNVNVYADWLLEEGHSFIWDIDIILKEPDFDENAIYDEIVDKIRLAMDDILIEQQKKLGIKSGDSTPIHEIGIDDSVTDMANALIQVLKYEKGV